MQASKDNFAMSQIPMRFQATRFRSAFVLAIFFLGYRARFMDRRELKPGVPAGKAKPVPAHPKTTTVGGFGLGAMLERASASFPPIVSPSFSRIVRRNAHTTQ